MNKKQYNNVIEHTLKCEQAAQTDDSLATARAIFDNMGVALPQGDIKTVYETIKTDNYMGWKSCTMQEAQAAADRGVAAIGISEDRIIVLSANDEEQQVTQTASVMTLDKNTSAFAVSDLQFFAYTLATTTYNWQYYAQRVLNNANYFLGKTEKEIENETNFSLSNGLWCVDFVRLCCQRAGVYHEGINIPKTSSSTAMRNWFRSNYPERFHIGIAGIQAGDIAFIKSSTSSTNPYHTCFAISSVKADGKVDTINGNWGDPAKVKIQSVPFSGGQIGWYVHPNYY